MTRNHALTLAVVDALAAAEHCAPQELDYSIHEYVDSEALSVLAAMERATWKLTFRVPGHEVTVAGDGKISVDGDVVRGTDDLQPHELQ
jgi:hypothetical protein